jgi:hypothetical protein
VNHAILLTSATKGIGKSTFGTIVRREQQPGSPNEGPQEPVRRVADGETRGPGR